MSNKLTIDKELFAQSASLNHLAKNIYQRNKAKGFWDEERNIGEMLMLVVSELGEAIEAHRKNRFAKLPKSQTSALLEKGSALEKTFFEEEIKDTFEDEIADAIIRLLDMVGGLGIDISSHLNAKVAYNSSRERLHGKTY